MPSGVLAPRARTGEAPAPHGDGEPPTHARLLSLAGAGGAAGCRSAGSARRRPARPSCCRWPTLMRFTVDVISGLGFGRDITPSTAAGHHPAPPGQGLPAIFRRAFSRFRCGATSRLGARPRARPEHRGHPETVAGFVAEGARAARRTRPPDAAAQPARGHDRGRRRAGSGLATRRWPATWSPCCWPARTPRPTPWPGCWTCCRNPQTLQRL